MRLDELAKLVEAETPDENGLLPCAHCGWKATPVIGSAKPPAHYVMCLNGDCNISTAMRAFAADAAQDWNRRALSPDRVRAMLDVIKAADEMCWKPVHSEQQAADVCSAYADARAALEKAMK